ncbi:MAG: 6-phosphofructokinase [Limisphaerales bacterium]
MSNPRKLGVLTSGGDAPGMNAAIRAVVRVGIARGLEVIGIQRGYQGLLENQFRPMGLRDVSNTIQRGGTVLHTSRSAEFRTEAGLRQAGDNLRRHGLDGLVLIGGDGTFRGAVELAGHWPGQLIGLPGTIDNDLWGTDHTIGFDTALNTALEAIDKVRDTAESHERFFLIEVMGRHSGFIALHVGISSGSEEILVPERPFRVAEICERLCTAKARGKTSSIIVVAEGNETGGAFTLAEELKRLSKNEYRVVILGYLQRGGTPTAADRLLGTKLGGYAVDLFLEGRTGVMAGEVGGQLVATPLRETFERRKPLDDYLLRLHRDLSQ